MGVKAPNPDPTYPKPPPPPAPPKKVATTTDKDRRFELEISVPAKPQCRCPCTCGHGGSCGWCRRRANQKFVAPPLEAGQSCEHATGGLCSACVERIRADGFQKGYQLGYETGVDYCRKLFSPTIELETS